MQLAGGNSALALAMTVLSNLLGILIVSCNFIFPYQMHFCIYLLLIFVQSFQNPCQLAYIVLCFVSSTSVSATTFRFIISCFGSFNLCMVEITVFLYKWLRLMLPCLFDEPRKFLCY